MTRQQAWPVPVRSRSRSRGSRRRAVAHVDGATTLAGRDHEATPRDRSRDPAGRGRSSGFSDERGSRGRRRRLEVGHRVDSGDDSAGSRTPEGFGNAVSMDGSRRGPGTLSPPSGECGANGRFVDRDRWFRTSGHRSGGSPEESATVRKAFDAGSVGVPGLERSLALVVPEAWI